MAVPSSLQSIIASPMRTRSGCNLVPTDRVCEDRSPECVSPPMLQPSDYLWPRRATSQAERWAPGTARVAAMLAGGTHPRLDSSVPDALESHRGVKGLGICPQCESVEHSHRAGLDTPSSVIDPKTLSKRLCMSVAYESPLNCSRTDSCSTLVLADIRNRRSQGELFSLACDSHGGRLSVRLTRDLLRLNVPTFDSRHCLAARKAFLILTSRS